MTTEEDLMTPDTLGLSFIDVLSCGLGGAIFLFLIFSAMPHLGSSSQLDTQMEDSEGSFSPASMQQLAEPGIQSEDELDAIGLSPLMVTVRVLSPPAYKIPQTAWEANGDLSLSTVGSQVAMIFLPQAKSVGQLSPKFVLPAGPEVTLQVDVIHAGNSPQEQKVVVPQRNDPRVVFQLQFPTLEHNIWLNVQP